RRRRAPRRRRARVELPREADVPELDGPPRDRGRRGRARSAWGALRRGRLPRARSAGGDRVEPSLQARRGAQVGERIMAGFTLPRRTILRGALGGVSAAVALPLLEAMVDANGEALADGAALPARFISWFFGNGVRLDRFVPAESHPNPWTLSEELQPL